MYIDICHVYNEQKDLVGLSYTDGQYQYVALDGATQNIKDGYNEIVVLSSELIPVSAKDKSILTIVQPPGFFRRQCSIAYTGAVIPNDYTTERLKAAYEKHSPYYDGFSEKEEKDMTIISGAKYVYDSANKLVGLTEDGKGFFRFDTIRQLLDSDYHTVPILEEELRLVEPPKGTHMWLCEYACGLKDSDDYFVELGNPALGRSASVNDGKVVLTDKLIEAIELNYTENRNTVSDLVGLCYVLDADTGNLLGFADGISRGYTDLKGQKLPMPKNIIVQAIRTHDLVPTSVAEIGLRVRILLVEGDQYPNGQSYQVATPYTPLSDTDKLFITKRLEAAYKKEEEIMSTIPCVKYVYNSNDELVGLTDNVKDFYTLDATKRLLDKEEYYTRPILKDELRSVVPPEGTFMWLSPDQDHPDTCFIELGNPKHSSLAISHNGEVTLTDVLIKAIKHNYANRNDSASDRHIGICYVLDTKTGCLLGMTDSSQSGYADMHGAWEPITSKVIVQSVVSSELIPIADEDEELTLKILRVGEGRPDGEYGYQVVSHYTSQSDTDKLFTTEKLRKAQNMLKLEDIVVPDEAFNKRKEALEKAVPELKGFGGDYDGITEEELIAEQEKNSSNDKSCDLLDAFGGKYNLIRNLKRPLINNEFVYAVRGYGLNDETYVPMVSKIGSVIDEGNGRFSLSLNAVEGSKLAVDEMLTYYVEA